MIFLRLPPEKRVPGPAASSVSPRSAGLLGASLLDEKPEAPASAAAPGSSGLGPDPRVSDTPSWRGDSPPPAAPHQRRLSLACHGAAGGFCLGRSHLCQPGTSRISSRRRRGNVKAREPRYHPETPKCSSRKDGEIKPHLHNGQIRAFK